MFNAFHPKSAAVILVVGDVMLDRYVEGTTSRISPEAPVPIVRVTDSRVRPGGAANVAVNIKSLGVGVQLAGISGDDATADVLASELDARGVAHRLVRARGATTVTKLRVLSQNQQLLRLDYEDDALAAGADKLLAETRELLSGADCVILSDYAKGALAQAPGIISAARQRGIPVLVDPKSRDFEPYRGATLVTPNAREFEAVAGTWRDEEEFVRNGLALCARFELGSLLVTRGESGMSLMDAMAGTHRHYTARAHEVFDVTGAGDTAIAVLGAALVSGFSLEQGVEFANAAAGLVVEKLGTASVTAAELNAALGGRAVGSDKLLSGDKLSAAILEARQRGDVIVMTNGCFDILHAGHVQFLEQARGLGNRLVVAVNDDDSVTRLKGSQRPVVPLADRIRLLAALESVDWVCPFSEDTPAALIEALGPDVLVKGGDYRREQVAGADSVERRGGRVIILPLLEGRSSSALISAVGRQGRTPAR